jgi:hypothetical protein
MIKRIRITAKGFDDLKKKLTKIYKEHNKWQLELIKPIDQK